MSVSYKDYYKILGVNRDAAGEEIQKSFRKLARKYHPDVSKEKGAEDRFKEINEAYEVLKDPEKRKLYDSLGSNWKQGQDFRPPPGFEELFKRGFGGGHAGGQRGGEAFSFGGFGGGGGGFSDFFNSIFGGFSFGEGFEAPNGADERMHRGARKGEDLETNLNLSLLELYRGGKKTVDLNIVEQGRGGAGATTRKQYSITIPPGTSEGSVIRLAGQGGRGAGGGEAGAILFKVKVSPHPKFKLSGVDLVGELPISPWEAALGAKVSFQTLDGEVRLSVPPGAQSGTRLRLREKGLPKSKTERGDMYAELKIVVPQTLAGEEKELFEKLSQASKFNPRA